MELILITNMIIITILLLYITNIGICMYTLILNGYYRLAVIQFNANIKP